MMGMLLDSLLNTTFKGSRAAKGLGDKMALIPTSAGKLRVYDSGTSRPALVFAPDCPCVIEHYADLIRRFESTHRVICFDMPGFGFSYPARSYRYSVPQTAKAIHDLFEQLHIKEASLAFSCANGLFGMGFAKAFPARVTKLILSQTPSLEALHAWSNRNIPKAVATPIVGQLIMQATKKRVAKGWYNLALPHGSPIRREVQDTARNTLDQGGCYCLASLAQGLSRAEAIEIEALSLPTLAIYGDRDRSHPSTQFESIREHIPQADLISFDQAGHFPDLEQSERFYTTVVNFLES